MQSLISISSSLFPTYNYIPIFTGFILSKQHCESENHTVFKSGPENHQIQRDAQEKWIPFYVHHFNSLK